MRRGRVNPNPLFRRVAEDFWVAPQLQAADMAEAKQLGIRTVINNRPDGEAPEQMPADEASAAASAAGLDYVHVPVVSGGIFPDHIAQMKQAVDGHQGPFLAYCRSGTRSCYLWAFVAAQTREPCEIIASAAAAGYDLSAMSAMLEDIHAANR
jgi:uncharacterized protein (TIGR01244 family)